MITVTEIEVVKGIYAAINSFDVETALGLLETDIVRVEPESFPSAGTYRGLDQMRVHLGDGRSKWAEGTCEPERLIVVDDKVIALIHVHVRLKEKVEWIDAHFGDVFTFKSGKIIEMRTFETNELALKWAGIIS